MLLPAPIMFTFLCCLIGSLTCGFQLKPQLKQPIRSVRLFSGEEALFLHRRQTPQLPTLYARSSKDEEETVPSLQINENDEVYFDLSPKKRLTVCKWQGKPRIDIREFYEKGGKLLPGKKGISLSFKEFQIIQQFMKDGTMDDMMNDLKENDDEKKQED